MKRRIFFSWNVRLQPVRVLIGVLLILSQACNFLNAGMAEQRNLGQVDQGGAGTLVPETGMQKVIPQPEIETVEEPEVQPTQSAQRRATRAPTSQLEPTLTSTAAEDDHEVSPDELQDLLSYGGWGAGYEGVCESGDPEIYLEDYFGGAISYINTGNPVYHGMFTSVVGCYFPPGETVSITFTLPDGSSSQVEARADDYGGWRVPWLSLPEEPVGEYEAYVESASGYASLFFEVARPESPIMTAACWPGDADGQLLLTGFVPGEEVLIGRYFLNTSTYMAELEDYQYYEIGDGGYLYLDIPKEKNLYVALGSESPREAQYIDDVNDIYFDTSANEFTNRSPLPCE